ncbi:MAG: PAS domain-containing protein [Acidobacteria bacterium Pan2503]|uniref:histidine kinase n=1 Tax=Candidatus Acidiferrum panamense TaxID=2741543 RepID=A0A7V8NVE2_9BACT|nr:PAS domain-containing protein [Candidatus Acidoferrum panamensis]
MLFVVAVLSYIFAAQFLEQLIHETDKRANDLAEQVFLQAKHALTEAARQGFQLSSDAPEEVRVYVRHAFEISQGLHTQLAAAHENVLIYEVSITDTDGLVLASTDENLRGTFLPRRASLSELVGRSFLHQIKVLLVPTRRTVKNPQLFEVEYPFRNGPVPFGEVRVIVDSALLVQSIRTGLRRGAVIVLAALVVSALLAAFVSGVTLAPLRDITAQLDRISSGQFDTHEAKTFETSDELGLMSRKISQVGQQLRGVHEIFSTMRENMNSVMAGLEDGLLLFTRDARAVMVSPAAEKFLGAPASEFLGRRVTDIFPPGHPLRDALHIESDELSEITAEADLTTSEGPKRVNVSVQAIQEAGERMGALVTLRDLDSLESIGTQLRVSERLAALGRITAGVAHEVKNPLNSMRLWLENLKESLSFDGFYDGDGPSRQAVQVLDKEIDRLDQVVKRFLDFTRPMDVRLEATQLAELLQEVLEVAKPQLQQSNIQIAQLLPIDVPEVYVDRALLKQAVLNLVLNAAEAMPNGGQLRLVLSRRAEMAEITVGDTGNGIPQENQQKIFQLFFTTRPGGSGIGLASTFRIVQLHNGSIDFTSEVGRGTTFRIELPLAA